MVMAEKARLLAEKESGGAAAGSAACAAAGAGAGAGADFSGAADGPFPSAEGGAVSEVRWGRSVCERWRRLLTYSADLVEVVIAVCCENASTRGVPRPRRSVSVSGRSERQAGFFRGQTSSDSPWSIVSRACFAALGVPPFPFG